MNQKLIVGAIADAVGVLLLIGCAEYCFEDSSNQSAANP